MGKYNIYTGAWVVVPQLILSSPVFLKWCLMFLVSMTKIYSEIALTCYAVWYHVVAQRDFGDGVVAPEILRAMMCWMELCDSFRSQNSELLAPWWRTAISARSKMKRLDLEGKRPSAVKMRETFCSASRNTSEGNEALRVRRLVRAPFRWSGFTRTGTSALRS